MDRSGEMFAVWIGVGIACFGAAIYGAETGHDITALFAVLMIGALLGTLILSAESLLRVWQTARMEQPKAKRESDGKLALLREVLDPDEWQSFKETLRGHALAELQGRPTADDGELPFEALIGTQESSADQYG